MMSGVGSYIPYIGAFVGGGLAVLLALAVPLAAVGSSDCPSARRRINGARRVAGSCRVRNVMTIYECQRNR